MEGGRYGWVLMGQLWDDLSGEKQEEGEERGKGRGLFAEETGHD